MLVRKELLDQSSQQKIEMTQITRMFDMIKLKMMKPSLYLVPALLLHFSTVQVHAASNNDVESAQIEAEEAQADLDATKVDHAEVKKRLDTESKNYLKLKIRLANLLKLQKN